MFIVRILAVLIISAQALLPTVAMAAVDGSGVVISEVQTGSSTSASQEFVELYNPTSKEVSLSGWTLEYKSATSTDIASNWKKYATMTGKIGAYGFYLISNYLPADTALSSSGLSSTGGNIRIKDGAGGIVDRVGYGSTANAAETTPAPAPPAGQSIERLPGRLAEASGDGTDTDNNFQDFILRTQPGPQSTLAPTEIPDGAPVGEAAGDQTIPVDDSVPVAASYAQIDITELLIDPQAPLTDAHDEFIELHNPGTTDVDLAGYVLRSGTNFHDFYILPTVTIPAGGYLALYAEQTKLSLVNTGGAAQLLDPDGNVVSQTAEYPGAEPGASWAEFVDGWQWTLQTTPSATNVLVTPVLSAVKAASSAAAKSAKKSTTSSVKSAKAKAPKIAKVKAKAAAAKTGSLGTAPIKSAAWLIIVLAIATIGYAIYEFRYDIRNFYYRLRPNQGARG